MQRSSGSLPIQPCGEDRLVICTYVPSAACSHGASAHAGHASSSADGPLFTRPWSTGIYTELYRQQTGLQTLWISLPSSCAGCCRAPSSTGNRPRSCSAKEASLWEPRQYSEYHIPSSFLPSSCTFIVMDVNALPQMANAAAGGVGFGAGELSYRTE